MRMAFGVPLGLAITFASACTPEPANIATSAPSIPRVTLLGDSLTIGYAPLFTAEYPGEVRVHAQDGQSTGWMLATITAALDPHFSDVLIVLGGVNDIASGDTIAHIERRLDAIAVDAERRGVRTVFLTLLPWRGYPSWTPKLQSRTDALNQWLRLHDAVVDVGTMLDDGDGRLKPEYRGASLPGGYLHPNTMGYRCIAHAVHMELTYGDARTDRE